MALSRSIFVAASPDVQSEVILRAEPSISSSIVGTIKPGEMAKHLDTDKEFYRIQKSDGQLGFVSRLWTELLDEKSTEEGKIKLSSGNLEIHFLDVGQGDASLVICPNGSTIVIDGGTLSGASADLARSYIDTRIAKIGHKIDHLVVTHPDADHYNLLSEVLDGIEIRQAYYVGDKQLYQDKDVFKWITTRPKATQLTKSYWDKVETPNPAIDCGDAQVWVLAAAIEAKKSAKNAMSIVLMIKHGSFKAIMTGDATFATEKAIMSRYPKEWLDSTVLKIGHHGSKATSTDVHWAKTIKPEIAVASAGYTNSFGHPRKEVVDKLTPYTIKMSAHPFRSATIRSKGSGGKRYKFTDYQGETEGVYATAANGTVTIVSDGSDYSVYLDQGEY